MTGWVLCKASAMSISKFLCSQIPKEENPLDGRLKSHAGIPRATKGYLGER